MSHGYCTMKLLMIKKDNVCGLGFHRLPCFDFITSSISIFDKKKKSHIRFRLFHVKLFNVKYLT